MARLDELTFAPLGGVGEIGMNLSIYGLGNRNQRSWLAVDLGVSFGDEEHLPGIDLIMPDIRFLEKERKNLMGLVLTHAHEDHFGAIIDLWPKLQCPIYATKFSAALFEAKCASERNPPKIPVTVVPSGGRINLGPFTVEFIPVAHSIPESHALAIHTSVGTVLHPGDWKIDGFWAPIHELLDRSAEAGFLRARNRAIVQPASTIDQALRLLRRASAVID
jgi:ribonuclease J